MAWEGYYTFDGTEIINASRVEAYAANTSFFNAVYRNAALPKMLGQTYSNPVTDNAPWYDPDVPASAQFYGVYPLEVGGLDDSSRTSEVVEYTGDGGSVGRLRHGTKSGVFRVAVIGATEEAADYGVAWLRRALLGAVCSTDLLNQQSLGVTMEYLSSAPKLDPSPLIAPATTMLRFRRTLKHVTVNSGPTQVAGRTLSCGSAFRVMSFTAVAGDPYEYGAPRPILQGFLNPLVSNPWAAGATAGTIEALGHVFREVECGEDLWEPMFDPLCPALVVPPEPPSVPLGCVDLTSLTGEVVTNTVMNPDMTSVQAAAELNRNRFTDPDFINSGASWSSGSTWAAGVLTTTATDTHSANITAVASERVTGVVTISNPTGATITGNVRIRGTLTGNFAGTAGPNTAFSLAAGASTTINVQSTLDASGQDGFRIQINGASAVGLRINRVTGLRRGWSGGHIVGSMAADDTYTYAWAGTANASESIQRYTPLQRYTPSSGTQAARTTRWSELGDGTPATMLLAPATGTTTGSNVLPQGDGTGNRHEVLFNDYVSTRVAVMAVQACETRLSIQQYKADGSNSSPSTFYDSGWSALAVGATRVYEAIDRQISGVDADTINVIIWYRLPANAPLYGEVLVVDRPAVFNHGQKPSGWTTVPYFSGATLDADGYDYAWTGAVDGSPSTRTDSLVTWRRHKVTLPAANIPLWGDLLPVVTVSAPTEARNVRVRFYRDPDGTLDPDDAPCDHVGDALISYIPAGGSIVIDGSERAVYAITSMGAKRRADSLVYRSDGKPYEWPALTCGYGYVLTVDLPPSQTVIPTVDLSFVPRVV